MCVYVCTYIRACVCVCEYIHIHTQVYIHKFKHTTKTKNSIARERVSVMSSEHASWRATRRGNNGALVLNLKQYRSPTAAHIYSARHSLFFFVGVGGGGLGESFKIERAGARWMGCSLGVRTSPGRVKVEGTKGCLTCLGACARTLTRTESK